PHGHLALDLVADADDRALGHVGMGGQDLFHAAGREPGPRDVDYVVHAAHDVDVTVLVPVAGVARQVVAGMLREVGLLVSGVVVPQGGQAPRRQRAGGA